jgi:hypothetical protein
MNTGNIGTASLVFTSNTIDYFVAPVVVEDAEMDSFILCSILTLTLFFLLLFSFYTFVYIMYYSIII